MDSIKKHKELIKQIPVDNQSSSIKKEVWDRFPYDDKIKKFIFGSKEKVEISRLDVHSVSNTKKKIITALMWGYPTGGRGKNIEKILEKIDELDHLLSSIKGKDLKKSEANKVYEAFGNIRGLGISTWSKLLYFFDVSIDSYKCQIYDMKIVDSLNKRQFSELGSQEWKQDNDHYYQYIKFLDEQAKSMDVKPDQIELFLFYYNLYYKFS